MKRYIDYFLKKYSHESFVIQLKARFILFTYFIVLVAILAATAYTIYANLNNPLQNYSINYKMISLYMGAFAIILFGLFLLVRGHYTYAAHFLIIIGFVLIWTVIIVDKTHVLSRLDTIVLAIALLSMLPLVFTKRPWGMFFYAVANIAMLLFVIFFLGDELNLPKSAFISYISDNTLAIIVVVTISYHVYKINKRALSKAEESEIRTQRMYYDLQIAEEEIRASNEELTATNDALSESLDELEQAKEKALESKEMYRSLLETVPDIIIKTDVEGNTIFANEQAFKLIGNIPEEELYGRNIMSFIAKEDLQRASENMQLMLQQNLGMQEYRINIDGEKFFHAEVNGEVIRDKNGNPVGMVFAIRDITERKRADEQILNAKEKAEESNRLKTAFLQNISHEVRTPLNAICGFSQFLSNPNLSVDDKNNYIDIILNSSDQLLSIVSDIITISSIETGTETPCIGNVCINTLIDEAKAVFDLQVSDKQITLKAFKSLPDKEAEVLADKAKLMQILNNLLANAIKFTPKGEIEFGFTLQANELEFYVKDSGIGIDKSKHEVIFDRFRQAEDNTHVDYGGTGLGLSICKGYVELLDGRIWVESELGKGATFYFTLPYKQTKKVKDSIDPCLTDNVVNNLSANKTVLVAEDQEFNYIYLETILKELNCSIIHARNGQQAVDFCTEYQNINLVLMDIKMPIMDGHTAAKIIKERKPNLPIVAQTAYATASEIEKYQGIFNDYITKPINSEELKSILYKYIFLKKE